MSGPSPPETGQGRPGQRSLRIADIDSDFEREPLRRPFGFKGGYMSEIWQTAALAVGPTGMRRIGLGTQNVLWSDARVFAAHSESGGNALMYAITERALGLARGREVETPVDLLDALLPEVHEYAPYYTRKPRTEMGDLALVEANLSGQLHSIPEASALNQGRIDQSLLDEIHRDPDDPHLVTTLLALISAHSVLAFRGEQLGGLAIQIGSLRVIVVAAFMWPVRVRRLRQSGFSSSVGFPGRIALRARAARRDYKRQGRRQDGKARETHKLSSHLRNLPSTSPIADTQAGT